MAGEYVIRFLTFDPRPCTDVVTCLCTPGDTECSSTFSTTGTHLTTEMRFMNEGSSFQMENENSRKQREAKFSGYVHVLIPGVFSWPDV